MSGIVEHRLDGQEQAWSDGLAVVDRLREGGFKAYLVGGCVRDRLLGVPVHDVDVATSASPEQVGELFPRHVDVGRQFGVMVVILAAGRHIEVASLRSDGAYVDGRHPQSIALMSVDERDDVQRRDFTINALLYDPQTATIHDHVGGLADLEKRILRVVGTPHQRLEEDRLRILRGLRFTARYGLHIEPSTWQAMQSVAMVGISRERIIEEWTKAFNHNSRSYWWSLVISSGHLHDLSPVAVSNPDLEAQLTALDTDGVLDCQAALALCWHHVPSRPRRLHLKNEPISRQLRETIVFVADQLDAGSPQEEHACRALIEHEAFQVVLRAWQVCGMAPSELAQWQHRWQQWQQTAPVIAAQDLMACGYQPGPQLGAALRAVADAQCAGRVISRQDALDLALRDFPVL